MFSLGGQYGASGQNSGSWFTVSGSLLLGAIAAAGYLVFLWGLRSSSYMADPLLDTYLEMAGSLIAFTFAANAMIRFRGTHDRISLILAFGFVLAG